MNKHIRRVLYIGLSALTLSGLGIFFCSTNQVKADQPVRVFKETNGRFTRCYYGFYYIKSLDKNNPHIHYQSGRLPRHLRRRGNYVSIYDPAVKSEFPVIKRHRAKYYIDDIDNPHRSHGKYYDEILINTRDVHGINNRQDNYLMKSFKRQINKNNRIIKRHHHNHKLVDKLEGRNGTLHILVNTNNTNNRMKMDPVRYHHNHKARRIYQRRSKRYSIRSHRSKKHSETDSTHKYLVGSNDYSGQIIDNGDFNDFAQHGDYSASGGNDGELVHIINQANVAGKTFYQIKGSGNDGWVYSGDLSDRPNGKAHPYDLDNMSNDLSQAKSNDIMSNYQQEIQDAREQNLRDVNADRASVGVQPAIENSQLDQLAELRSQQAVKDFHHRNANDYNLKYATIDAPQFGLSKYYDPAENLDETDGNNGTEAGDNANTAWWTNEKGATPDQDGGHRKNIEDPTNQYIGIGATYDPSSGDWYFAQDFGDNDSDSSQDLNPNGYYYTSQSSWQNFVQNQQYENHN